MYKTNKQMHKKHTDQLQKCSLNHKATQNKNNIGSTALERPVTY